MYLYISIYIYIHISLYIYIYILKKKGTFCALLQKNKTFSRSFTFFAFFYVLCKRTLRSFKVFAKECCVLCTLFHSLEKNGKERNNLLGSISHQKLKKRTEKNVAFFKRTEKNGTF